MKYKTPHLLYVFLLIISIVITALTFFIDNSAWSTVVASVGAGGIASVVVAWLLDYRKTKIQAIEDKAKHEELMRQFVRIYRRLMSRVASECYRLCGKDEQHSFQFWIQLLSSNVNSFPKEGQYSIKNRCSFISSSVESLQRQIEIFQSQTATLIYQDFPDIEKTLQFFELLWTHCWGTLKQLEIENYKVFIDTTYILYLDFIKEFPRYKDDLPDEYSINEAIHFWNESGSHPRNNNESSKNSTKS